MAARVLDDYPRRQHLEFYRGYPDPFYSLTFTLTATELIRGLKAEGLPVYAGLCWAFHRGLQPLDAFRVRLVGEDVVLHDDLGLGMTVPGPRRTFNFLHRAWDADARRFLVETGAAMRAVAEQEGLRGGGEAADAAYYTTLPRVPFTGFTHAPLADRTAGQPLIAFGRFEVDAAGCVRVPVGVQVNHMYVDGADLGDLYEATAASFERGL